jgi:predicted alpha/beta-fold hydrolase
MQVAKMSKRNELLDPLESMMAMMVEGFRATTTEIQTMKTKQKQQAVAAYHGMTGSGKSRYVSKLVEIEAAQEPRGAQARVADTLDLSEGRISQLLSSEKNRKNGK